MPAVFTLIGILLAAYVLYAVATGEVIAKAGAGSRRVRRHDAPGYYWTVIAIYAGLAVALFTVF